MIDNYLLFGILTAPLWGGLWGLIYRALYWSNWQSDTPQPAVREVRGLEKWLLIRMVKSAPPAPLQIEAPKGER